jgi:glycyl-tRNA synthetase beta chain
MMKWGDLDIKFARPLSSILLMYNGKPVPLEFNNLKNEGITRGHMLLAPDPVEVSTFEDYREKLRQARVEIDPAVRHDIITREIEDLLEKDKEVLLEDPGLLKENVFLVEYPKVFRGVFQEHFLELPQPVLISSIRKHQKAFAITDMQGRMVPSFLVVSNMPLADMEKVRKGYEQVLGARLADAFFFYQEDMKRPISGRQEQLSRVIYQKELGSLKEKVERVSKIVALIGDMLDLRSKDTSKIGRAAELCKSDLVTEMVQEFPELQGTMGMEYALRMGEPEEIAQMIRDHYLPRFPGDKLPSSDGGAILSLADRVDTIVGGYGLGIIPTGTKDPYGLKRAGRGFVEIIHTRKFSFPVSELIGKTVKLFGNTFKKSGQVIEQEVLEFMMERLDRYMLDNGVRYDTAAAVLATEDDDLHDLADRMTVFESFRNTPDYEPLAVAFKRAGRILTPEATERVNPGDFVTPEEKELYDAFLKMEEEVIPLLENKEYMQGLQGMARIRPILDRFYDEVMVMDEDPVLRKNRLSLMKLLSDAFGRFADFTKLVIAKTGSDTKNNEN